MAIDKVIDSTVLNANLTTVANAIRAKGGTSAALAFPDGFVSAVGAIETGSGGSADEWAVFRQLNAGELVSAVIPEDITKLHSYLFSYSNLESITALGVTELGEYAFQYSDALKTVNLPNLSVKTLMKGAFYKCTALESISFPNLGGLASSSSAFFSGCTALKNVDLPICTSLSINTFQTCSSLEFLDFPVVSSIAGGSFASCTALTTLVLRNATVATLGNVSAFTNTPLAGYGGTYSGHIYVPSALMTQYQTGTNWATLYANYPEIFQPIEGSEYE